MRRRLTAEDIARELGGGKETRQGDGWVTLCPAHHDSSPSMSVTDGKDGKILVRCHARCKQADVVQALKDRDLWPAGNGRSESLKSMPHAPTGTIMPTSVNHYDHGDSSKVWHYYDRQGRPAGLVARFDKPNGKLVVPMVWCVGEDTGQGKWWWRGFGKDRPLYGAHLIPSSPREVTVLVVEGEKACDAAREKFPSMLVISWQGGAKAAANSDWSLLKGRKVVIWPDHDQPGQEAAARIAEILIDVGAESVSVVALPEDLPEGWDLADPLPEGVEMDEKLLVGAAKPYTPSGDVVVDELNRSYSLTIMGDKPVVIWERPDPIRRKRIIPVYTSPNAVRTMLANRMVSVGKGDVNAFEHWLTHPGRRTYQGIVFEPGDDVPGYFNLWRGFTVVPEATGDWSMLREHIHENVAQGDESLEMWVLAWFAQMMQDPKRKPGTSLAMRGKQGVGKTKVGELMGHLIRDNYVYVDDSRYVLGNFNQHMGHALMLQADEGFFAGDPRHTGRLKGLVTAETNRIEPKGKDSFEIQNYMRLLVTSNMDWIVPTAFEERRFAIVDVGTQRMQDRAYFKEMDRQMEQGGYEGLLHYLLNMDLSTIDVGVIPKTAALMDQKEHSFDPVQRYWFERLRDGATMTSGTKWELYVSCEYFYKDFIERCQTWGIYRRPSDTQFIRDLEALAPPGSFERNKRSVEIMQESGYSQNRRLWCHDMPDLDSARSAFEQRIGAKIDWPVDGKPSPASVIDDERLL